MFSRAFYDDSSICDVDEIPMVAYVSLENETNMNIMREFLNTKKSCVPSGSMCLMSQDIWHGYSASLESKLQLLFRLDPKSSQQRELSQQPMKLVDYLKEFNLA